MEARPNISWTDGTCGACGHPYHCHAPANKQADGGGGALCVRCYNDDGEFGKAWHAFQAADV